MKKILSIILALALVFTLCSCGTEKKEEPAATNEITELMADGYTIYMTSYDENRWNGVLAKYAENVPESFYKVKAQMTAEKYEEMSNIPWDAEDYDQLLSDFLGTLEVISSEDINSMIPSQEELDQYIGKTLGDLEDEGFENSGNSNWEGVCEFYYDGPVYSCTVGLKEGTIIENMDDYSVNDLKKLEIGSMNFTGLSYHILDEEQ